MATTTENPRKIVLAYSGGLDTSVILPWLKERYPGVKLVAFAAELGQGDELKGIEDKAYKSGADEVVIMDLARNSPRNIASPCSAPMRFTKQDYLLGTSIARPMIAGQQVEVARQTGADAVGHGATGKGNDQVRFELTYMALGSRSENHRAVERPDIRAARPRKRHRLRQAKKASPSTRARRKSTARTAISGTSAMKGAEIESPANEPNG